MPWEDLGMLYFCSLSQYIIDCDCEAPSHQFHSISGWIWTESRAVYTLEFILLLPSAVTSPINTMFHWPLNMAMHSTASTKFDRWCGVLQIMSCSFASMYFSLPIILVNLGSILINMNIWRNKQGVFRCVLVNSSRKFLFWSVANYKHYYISATHYKELRWKGHKDPQNLNSNKAYRNR